MNSDRAIESVNDDKLGFGELANHLAIVINSQSVRDGFVIGVEGKWGSGKSSLINLTRNALIKKVETKPEIIFFSPWIIGNREELLAQLLGELARAADQIEIAESSESENIHSDKLSSSDANTHLLGNKKNKNIQIEHDKWAKKFKKFADAVTPVIRLTKPINPYAENISDAINVGANIAVSYFVPRDLEKQKKSLIDDLQKLSKKIIIFIDDLDRLEPKDATEILRLIKAVADFPNVIYVLSYDRNVLAGSISKAGLADDGQSFLEKIVQVSFCVPQPEAFDLRQWFSKELENELEDSWKSRFDTIFTNRLYEVIDTFGDKYLKSPRDVVRLLNALRLHALPVISNIDLADMIFLQLVRINHPRLFRWIEEYIIDYACIWDGAHVSEADQLKRASNLDEIIQIDCASSNLTRKDISKVIPGLEFDPFEKSKNKIHKIFNDTSDQAVHKLIREKRLASPEHFRFYFALSRPSGAMDDGEYDNFISLAERNQNKACIKFAQLMSASRPQGGLMAEVLIERIMVNADKINQKSLTGIILAFGHNLDLAKKSFRPSLFAPKPWRRANKAVDILLKRISDPDYRALLINKLFNEGKALGWLASVLREEIYAHGHYGERSKLPEDCLLNVHEFNDALAVMLLRFDKTPSKLIMQVPELLNLLFCWKEGAQNDDAKKWVERNTRSDEGLLEFLSNVRSFSHSSVYGLQFPLIRRNLEPFIDYDQSLARVKIIANSKKASGRMKKRARDVLESFIQGDKT